MNRFLFAAISILTFFGFMFQNRPITIKGSDTMVILGQRWAEVYMSKNPGTSIQVTGGGSGTGIAALINGTTDICQSSRPIKKSEIEKIKARHNVVPVEIAVARDGLAVYLHESNPVSELTLEQIKDIYTGKITNWKAVGGPDARIILYSRENNSGTYVYFKDNVLNGADFAAYAQHMPGTAAVVNAVAKDRFGIGYGGAAYAKGIKECKVKKDANSPGYKPTPENIKSGKYPVSRELFFYTRNKPSGNLKAFIDWILSTEGQELVVQVGYFPIK